MKDHGGIPKSVSILPCQCKEIHQRINGENLVMLGSYKEKNYQKAEDSALRNINEYTFDIFLYVKKLVKH